ncbi:MAG: ABC transporter permease [Bacillota bacterium]
MKRFFGALRNDILLQIKYGFYTVYTIVTLVYVLLLRSIPSSSLDVITPFIIFSDPAFLGFYFIGGLILLEKGENTLEYLISTPLREKEYLLAKMVSLTLLAVLASLVIASFGYTNPFNLLLMITGLVLTSFLYILVGFVAVARFKTVNEYILTSIVYMFALNLPILGYFRLIQTPWFYLFPSQASLLLIRGAFQPVEVWEIIYGVIYLICWNIFMFKWAYRSFYRFIVLREGME